MNLVGKYLFALRSEAESTAKYAAVWHMQE